MSYFREIENQIVTFFQDITKNEDIDMIICAERKATAILRAIISEISPPSNFVWEWPKVLSTAALPQFDWGSFKGRKVLLFDELIHHGKTLEKHKDTVSKYLPSGVSMVTAGFAVWDRCADKPDFSYYSAVDSETYEQIREDIVYMLQKHGSLLLDTEHIELSARIQCGVKEFYDELARSTEHGKAYSFTSGADRMNLTIDQPDLLLENAIGKMLPPGSNVDGSVCKIRVLERSHETFAILPIFYPNVKMVASGEWTQNLPPIMRKQFLNNITFDKATFYMVGLLCSIELIRGVAAALNDLMREEKVILEIPKENFYHLHTMFPNIDTNELADYVSEVVAESKRDKAKKSRRAARSHNVPTEKLLVLSSRVMKTLVEAYDNNTLLDCGSPIGMSWKELHLIAESESRDLGLDVGALTIVVDRLIDAGLVVTKVEEVKSSRGESYYIRTFAPDGEVVSSKIRQQIMVRDPECLLAI